MCVDLTQSNGRASRADHQVTREDLVSLPKWFELRHNLLFDFQEELKSQEKQITSSRGFPLIGFRFLDEILLAELECLREQYGSRPLALC